MINIQKIDHVGIRIRDKQRSISFYETLEFELLSDTGFEQGHPIIMRHPSGVVLNLLGPSSMSNDENILMDVAEKYCGYTHIALRVESIENAAAFFEQQNYTITGRMEVHGMKAIFIRDPDRNVIEFDEYEGEKLESRLMLN